ncbi:MAG: hypothetical protein ACHRXM_19565, partial [Isosphaerales bacterium]
MRSISFPRALAAPPFSRNTGRNAQRRARSLPSWSPEGLEARLVLSTIPAATPVIQMLSATTTDSKSVTIEYQVNQPANASTPI